ncbi:MAG: hypothetical protein ABI480_08245 [Chitinophagaceae bacterium]
MRIKINTIYFHRGYKNNRSRAAVDIGVVEKSTGAIAVIIDLAAGNSKLLLRIETGSN